jgi:hypothetical protein
LRLVHNHQALDFLSDAVKSAGQMSRTLGACGTSFLTVDPVSLLDVALYFRFQMREATGEFHFFV